MANGFWLGGASEGIQSANKQMLAESTLAQDTALRTRGLDLQSRGLDIQEKSQKRIEDQKLIERVDTRIADTMGVVAETIKAGLSANKDPQTLSRIVQPLVDQAKTLGGRVGRSPAAFDAQVQAMLGQPGLTESATAAGTAKAATTVAQETALTAAGVSPNRFESHEKRVGAENSLRDDYLKQSSNFMTIRDAKNRMDSLDFTANPGASDLALVFDYMKILDPNSTVREGEFKTATQITGLPGVIESLRNKILGDGQLNETARKQILSQAGKLYQSQATQQDKLTTQFANTAKRQGLSIDNVIFDLSPNAPVKKGGGGGTLPPPPAGFNLVP